ncbi:MAG: phosphoribosylformylglycinamidine synthase subunit PurS [Candidatus Micrarchaeota archaeon]
MALQFAFTGGIFVQHKEYAVEIAIESKPGLADPEGSVIAGDLMRKNGFGMVSAVRVAKLLRVTLSAASEEDAKKIADRMCIELRLANPVSQAYSIIIRK